MFCFLFCVLIIFVKESTFKEFKRTVAKIIYQKEGSCVACGSHSDAMGDDAISCRAKGERIARHNQLRDALFHTASSALLAPSREERALLSGGDQRPADVLISNWSGGKDAAMDITVVNPLQLTLLARAAVEPGYALGHAYHRKWQKHGDACWAEGIIFHPLLVETMGGWSESAAHQVSRLGQALARAMGQEELDTIRHLFGRLSILLMRGNSALLINCVPSYPDPQVDGVL